MPDWLWFVAFFVVYIVLMRWVLPYLGVEAQDRSRANPEERGFVVARPCEELSAVLRRTGRYA